MTNRLQDLAMDSIKKLVEQTFIDNLTLNKRNKSFASDMAAELQRQWTAIKHQQADDIADFIDFDSVIAFENKDVRVLNRLDPSKMHGTKDLIVLLPKYNATKPNSLKQLRKYVESKIAINWARVTFMSVEWNTKNRQTFTCDLVRYLIGNINILFWFETGVVSAKDEVILASWHRLDSLPTRISIEAPLCKDTNSRVFRTAVDYANECDESGQPMVDSASTEITTEFRVGEYKQQFGRMKRS